MILLYNFEFEDFEYEVDNVELQEAIVNIVLTRNNARTTTTNESKLLLMLVNELDIIYNNQILDELEEEIKEYFYEDAFLRYQQENADSEDAETWYGTKNDIVGE